MDRGKRDREVGEEAGGVTDRWGKKQESQGIRQNGIGQNC